MKQGMFALQIFGLKCCLHGCHENAIQDDIPAKTDLIALYCIMYSLHIVEVK